MLIIFFNTLFKLYIYRRYSMTEDVIQELSRRSILLTKNEEPTISWNNSVIVVRTDRGNHYFQYTYNLECLDKNIDLLEYYTPVSKESPAANLFSHKLFSTSWRNSEFTEMLINPALWPHNPQMVEELTNICLFEWSPKGFVQNSECALAVLNNIGNVNFYMFFNSQWMHIFSLAPYLRELLEECSDLPQNLNELKQAVDTVDACGLCWSPNLNTDNSCYFVTAQKNGAIVFWYLQCDEADMSAKVCGMINNDKQTKEISTMLWIPMYNEKFLLVCSDFFGKITAYECIIGQEEIKDAKSYTLWSHNDRMVVKYFYYVEIEKNIILIFNKHRHLVIQLFDENCKLISQFVKNVNDNRISSIINSKDGFYISTVNSEIYKIDLKIIDNNLDVSTNLVDFKAPGDTYELCSMESSYNNVIWALGMVNRKPMSRKEPVLLDILFSSSNKKAESALPILLNNPSRKLTNYWDCVALIRYKALKTNSMPSTNYDDLYAEANTDIYKLKVYLILVRIFVTLKKVIRVSTDLSMPESSIEVIKEKILLSQAITVLNDIQNKDNEVNIFEAECVQGAKCYLSYYCKKYEKSLEEFIDSNTFNNIEFNQEYICQCCDEKLEGFSCKDGHLNMVCSLTFTPIESDEYLVCRGCGVTARVELFSKHPICVFCDLYLQKSYINVKI